MNERMSATAIAGVVLDHLNERCGKKFRHVLSNYKHILARLNEGYTIEDLVSVIECKAEDAWFLENSKYLRPGTLFNSEKFSSYLDEAETGCAGQKKVSQVTVDNKQALQVVLKKVRDGR